MNEALFALAACFARSLSLENSSQPIYVIRILILSFAVDTCLRRSG